MALSRGLQTDAHRCTQKLSGNLQSSHPKRPRPPQDEGTGSWKEERMEKEGGECTARFALKVGEDDGGG